MVISSIRMDECSTVRSVRLLFLSDRPRSRALTGLVRLHSSPITSLPKQTIESSSAQLPFFELALVNCSRAHFDAESSGQRQCESVGLRLDDGRRERERSAMVDARETSADPPRPAHRHGESLSHSHRSRLRAVRLSEAFQPDEFARRARLPVAHHATDHSGLHGRSASEFHPRESSSSHRRKLASESNEQTRRNEPSCRPSG